MTLRTMFPALVAMFLLQGCLALTPQAAPSTVETLAAADKALERGDRAAARRGYEAAIARAPDLVSPHFQLGVMAYGRGDDRAARRRFSDALERDPGHVLATYNLAIVHLQQARMLLDRHEQLAPVSAGRADLMAIRAAIDGLRRSTRSSGDE